jgi:hypothetical protein
MSIALTPFEAMCGFRTVSEIRKHLFDYPELASILGADGVPSPPSPSLSLSLSLSLLIPVLRISESSVPII